MKITIIGWYGTETIGDRAILAGLVSFFYQAFNNVELLLGSLNPFFSQRTIVEDTSFIKKITDKNTQFKLFNSKSSKQLLSAIKESDLVVMGGGPLMDLDELFMVEYAFKKAKKIGVKTAILGCGIGPLFSSKYKKSVLNIFLNSDLSILRDSTSKINIKNIYSEFGVEFIEKNVHISFDPAVQCVIKSNFLDSRVIPINEPLLDDYIAVNLREFPLNYSCQKNNHNINISLTRFVGELADQFPNKIIKLIPMHYFHIGNDDRVFLNNLARELNRRNIEVQNIPLTLSESIKIFRNAYFNIGMRFHSVVLQTIASGKNYILDYTEPKKGKINGFLMDIDKKSFYKSKYIALQKDNIPNSFIKFDEVHDKFVFDEHQIHLSFEIYKNKLQKLMK